ncbi:MAG: glycosyltransferase family 2 protein [Candidatus Eisenbacteria sp.]|nr:glycosyltransferase family 2 protein [Candidatus Eisenbacteria bacterium]
MHETTPLVSVIIPSYTRMAELATCLNALLTQDYPNLEITVVDDASSDGTVHMVKRDFPSVHVLQGRTNRGPAHRRNQGILASRGEYLLFLDSDVRFPDADVIARMVARMSTDPCIGELGGEIPLYEGDQRRAYGRRVGYTGRTFRVPAEGESDALTPCDYVATCHCMIRSEVARQVSGFDPHYRFGAEDADFGLAIRMRGYRNCVAFAYAALHQGSRTGRLPDETYQYYRTQLRLLWKRGGAIRPLVRLGLDALRVLIFYPLLPLKLLAYVILGRRIGRESLIDPWLILKAYDWNLRHLSETQRARTADFLASAEIERFRRSATPRREP